MFKGIKKFLAMVLMVILVVNCSNCYTFADGFGNVMLIGNFSGGKTQIFNVCVGDKFDESGVYAQSTVAIHRILNLKADDTGLPIATIRLYDTPGADQYYDEVVEMARVCHVVVIVHDLMQETNKIEGEKNKAYFNRLYRDLSSRMPDGGKIVFVGSKMDRQAENITNYSENRRMLKDVAEATDSRLILTSAKTGKGIEELIDFIKASFSTMRIPERDTENRYNMYQLIPDPTLTSKIKMLEEAQQRLAREKAEIESAKKELEKNNAWYAQKKKELESQIEDYNATVRSLEKKLEESKKKEKIWADYIPIVGSFLIK